MAPGPPDGRPAPPGDATGRRGHPVAQTARRGYGTDASPSRDDAVNRPGNPREHFAGQPFQDGEPARRRGGEPPGFGQGRQAARGPSQGRPPAGRPMPPADGRPPAPGPNGRPTRPQLNGRPSPPWNGPNERGEAFRSNGGPPALPPPSGRPAARPPSRPNGQPTQAGRLPAHNPAQQPYGRAGTDGRGPTAEQGARQNGRPHGSRPDPGPFAEPGARAAAGGERGPHSPAEPRDRTYGVGRPARRPDADAAAGERTQTTTGRRQPHPAADPSDRTHGAGRPARRPDVDAAAGERTQTTTGRRRGPAPSAD